MNAGLAVSKDCSLEAVRHLLEWCVADSTQAGDGILCQVDDGRYMNSARKPSLQMCPTQRAMCAKRTIRAGDELTEDYEVPISLARPISATRAMLDCRVHSGLTDLLVVRLR